MDLRDIRQWDLTALEQLDALLGGRIVTVEDAQDRIADIGRLHGWQGEAAEAARQRFRVTADELTDEIAAMAAVRTVTNETRVAVTHLKNQLIDIDADADADKFWVENNGAVVSADKIQRAPEESAAREERRVTLEARAKALILQAEDIANDAAAVMNRAARGEIDDRGAVDHQSAVGAGADQGHLSAPWPPADTSPAAAQAYWDAMPESQRREVISQHPEWVGNRDGIPSGVRHEANLNRIGGERARLEGERDKLKVDIANHPFGGAFTNEDAKLWYVERKLEDLDKLQELSKSPDFRILSMDMTGERGKAAFAIGNPDTADHIAVTAPGINTTVGGSFSSMKNEAEGLRDLSKKELERVGRPNETVATIGWLGYEPPNVTGPGWGDTQRGWGDAGSESKAREAAGNLANFYEGLETVSNGNGKNPHITAIGHSYGSLVTGTALQESGNAVDDVVVYGSPGIAADKTEQLGVAPGHVYTMLGDKDDWINKPTWAQWYGPDPHSNPNFTHLSSDATTTPDGVPRDGAHSHADYPRTGSDSKNLRTSGYNVAAVVIGQGQELAVKQR